MIQLEVLFFANLAETAGRRSLSVTMADGGLTTLMATLADHLSAEALQALHADNVRMARNQALWDGAEPLADGDEVAFLPPVTGG